MKKAILPYIAMVVLFGIVMIYPFSNYRYATWIDIPEPLQTADDDHFYINLNQATAAELERIPGVGPSLAENIISYREEIGQFTDYSQLLNVKGIGHSKIKVILKYVRII